MRLAALLGKLACWLSRHDLRLVEQVEDYGCPKYKCARCGHIHVVDGWAGRAG